MTGRWRQSLGYGRRGHTQRGGVDQRRGGGLRGSAGWPRLSPRYRGRCRQREPPSSLRRSAATRRRISPGRCGQGGAGDGQRDEKLMSCRSGSNQRNSARQGSRTTAGFSAQAGVGGAPTSSRAKQEVSPPPVEIDAGPLSSGRLQRAQFGASDDREPGEAVDPGALLRRSNRRWISRWRQRRGCSGGKCDIAKAPQGRIHRVPSLADERAFPTEPGKRCGALDVGVPRRPDGARAGAKTSSWAHYATGVAAAGGRQCFVRRKRY